MSVSLSRLRGSCILYVRIPVQIRKILYMICPHPFADYEEPHTLLILAEEELVAVDLVTDSWPTFKLPYLGSMHSSAITCAHHVGSVPEQLWSKIVDAGEAQLSGTSARVSGSITDRVLYMCFEYSRTGWPVTGKSAGEKSD